MDGCCAESQPTLLLWSWPQVWLHQQRNHKGLDYWAKEKKVAESGTTGKHVPPPLYGVARGWKCQSPQEGTVRLKVQGRWDQGHCSRQHLLHLWHWVPQLCTSNLAPYNPNPSLHVRASGIHQTAIRKLTFQSIKQLNYFPKFNLMVWCQLSTSFRQTLSTKDNYLCTLGFSLIITFLLFLEEMKILG